MPATTTRDPRAFVNHWSMWGAFAMVERLGSRWAIRPMFGVSHPGLWRTRREAVEALNNMVVAMPVTE